MAVADKRISSTSLDFSVVLTTESVVVSSTQQTAEHIDYYSAVRNTDCISSVADVAVLFIRYVVQI